ncbi:unnamed protein product [Rhizophagus irregularis]|nr:unnamed protein product [Rhizophagus irregularis]
MMRCRRGRGGVRRRKRIYIHPYVGYVSIPSGFKTVCCLRTKCVRQFHRSTCCLERTTSKLSEEYSLAIIHRVGVLCVGVGRRKISRPEPHANRRSSGPQEKKYAIRNGYPNIRILDY